MKRSKQDIINMHCYTDLVYSRIRKKLSINSSDSEIETLILNCLKSTPEDNYIEEGKNIYVYNHRNNIRITVNSNTCRIITVDKLIEKTTTN